MNEMEDRWLSITEICKYLGVSNDTVYKWIDKHGMPAHRMGRLWKFKKDEVDAWVKAGGAARACGQNRRERFWTSEGRPKGERHGWRESNRQEAQGVITGYEPCDP